MRLDANTLIIVHGVISIFSIIALAIQNHLTRRYRAVRLWLAGFTCLFLGFLCILSRLLPGFEDFSIIGNNFFFISGWLLISTGFLHFFGKDLSLSILYRVLVAYMVAILFFTFVENNMLVRLGLFSITWAAIMITTAIWLLRLKETRLIFMRRLTSGILFIQGGFFVFRAALVPFANETSGFFMTDPVQLVMNFILAVMINLIVIIIIIMINHRLQVEAHEARDGFAEMARQRELLMQELQHRVKNNLNMVAMFLSIEKSRHQSDELLNVLTQAISRIHVISSIYDRLYLASDLTKIDISSWVRDITSYVASVSPQGLTISVEAEKAFLNSNVAVPLGLILTELLINASKYAYGQGESGEVRVACRLEMGTIVLTVEDDGVGLAQDYNPEESEGLGMRLITSLAKQLDGAFTIVGKTGTQARLVFPQPNLSDG